MKKKVKALLVAVVYGANASGKINIVNMMINSVTIKSKDTIQLIFTTHNPIYLDGDLLRHDQMIMVKKEQESLVSELYTLSNFVLRPEEKILKNYLNGKYGVLPKMDLEIAFKKILFNN